MHTHISALNAMIILAYVLILGFMLRMIQHRYPDSEVSKALAFIY